MKNSIICILLLFCITACKNDKQIEQEKRILELENKIAHQESIDKMEKEKALRLKEQELAKKEAELKQKERVITNKSKEKTKNTSSSKPQKRLAVINDPDGYTNVRKGKSTKTDIIDRLYEGEHYEVYPSSSSNWWKVKTQSNTEGYVHKSRIRIIE